MARPMGADAKLISTTTDGDYIVSRYLVKESRPDGSDFAIRYQINLSRMISTYDQNEAEILALHKFIDELKQDTLKRVTMVNVVGYASPDGTLEINERLAMERAADMRSYINKNCGMSDFNGSTSGVAQPWSATRRAILNSSMPNRSEVLSTIEANHTQAQIEQKLRGMSSSWNYLKGYILPPMRCVELEIHYTSWRIVEIRELTEKPASAAKQKATTQYVIMVIDESSSKPMIELPTAPLDYDNDKIKYKFKDNARREKFKGRDRMGYSRGRIVEKRKY